MDYNLMFVMDALPGLRVFKRLRTAKYLHLKVNISTIDILHDYSRMVVIGVVLQVGTVVGTTFVPNRRPGDIPLLEV